MLELVEGKVLLFQDVVTRHLQRLPIAECILKQMDFLGQRVELIQEGASFGLINF